MRQGIRLLIRLALVLESFLVCSTFLHAETTMGGSELAAAPSIDTHAQCGSNSQALGVAWSPTTGTRSRAGNS